MTHTRHPPTSPTTLHPPCSCFLIAFFLLVVVLVSIWKRDCARTPSAGRVNLIFSVCEGVFISALFVDGYLFH